MEENELGSNTQSRRYMLTINNPEYTDEQIIKYIEDLEHFKYCMLQREKGEETGTEHIQAFIVFSIAVSISLLSFLPFIISVIDTSNKILKGFNKDISQ